MSYASIARFIIMLLFLELTVTLNTDADAQSVSQEKFNHAKLDTILKSYLKSNFVDYKRLKKDGVLQPYLDELNGAKPNELGSREEKIAFWINAYNAYTLKLILDHYPVKSILNISRLGKLTAFVGDSPWKKEICKVGGKVYTLDHIEHTILRGEFKEERVHFAANCASFSCPLLRAEAYTGDNLNAQLDEQARLFINDGIRNRFDKTKNVFYASEIFKWYKDDFVKKSGSLPKYLAQYASDDAKRFLLGANPEIDQIDYNWDLNEQK
jgi:hypothetical protein